MLQGTSYFYQPAWHSRENESAFKASDLCLRNACRFFLPPIILHAGLSVRKKAFFRNLPTIASLGILGTYIAFAVIAFTLYGFSKVINITLAVRAPCYSLTTE